MKQNTQNPVTGNGAGAGSENQFIPCVGVVSYVEFYPGVKGTIFYLEVVPAQGETAEDALTRTRAEAYKLADSDRDTMFHYNTNLSTEGYHVGEVIMYKINGELICSVACLDQIPEYDEENGVVQDED